MLIELTHSSFKNLVLFLFIFINLLGIPNVSSDDFPYLCNAAVGFRKSFRIVGGHKASIEEYPFIAALIVKGMPNLFPDSIQCGCTIIAKKWAVTATHCLQLLISQQIFKDDVSVRAGHRDWRKGNRHDVQKLISHEQFDEDTMGNDIALIHVKQPFQNKFEVAWPLASPFYSYEADTEVTVLGWGVHNVNDEDAQTELEFVNIHLFDQAYCRRLYEKHYHEVLESQVCAGEKQGGKDSCQYDSGGPLVDGDILIGIVSWGIDCGKKHKPGVYTKVSHYGDWIVEKCKLEEDPINITCSGNITLSHIHHPKSRGSFKIVTDFVVIQITFILITNFFMKVNI